MKNRSIVLLGASKPHEKLYTKAHELGLTTHCIAWSQGAYCKDLADYYCDISIQDKKEVLNYCHTHQVDAILSNALEMAMPTVAYVNDHLHLPGVSGSLVATCVNKHLTHQVVASTHTCRRPAYWHLGPHDQVPSLPLPVIVKPVDASRSIGIQVVHDSATLSDAIASARAASTSGDIIIEEYLEGWQVEVDTLSYHGQHQVIVMTDMKMDKGTRITDIAHHQPSQLPLPIQNKLRDTTLQILDAMGVTDNACFLEFIITPDATIYFIEMAVNGGGGGLTYHLAEQTTGYDLIGHMIRVALGDSPAPYDGHIQHYTGIFYETALTPWISQVITDHHNAPWMTAYEYYARTDPRGRSGHFMYCIDTLDEQQELISLVQTYAEKTSNFKTKYYEHPINFSR